MGTCLRVYIRSDDKRSPVSISPLRDLGANIGTGEMRVGRFNRTAPSFLWSFISDAKLCQGTLCEYFEEVIFSWQRNRCTERLCGRRNAVLSKLRSRLSP